MNDEELALQIANNWDVEYFKSGEINKDAIDAIMHGVKIGRIMALENVLKNTVGTDANFRLKYSLELGELKEKFGL